MNTNKIFRIFAKDLQAGKDKKFVGVVETVPPNNVITLTIPTLKEAFVFSAHDPMKASMVDDEDLCVKFTATLTDGSGPGETQEYLFFFSTEIKVKAFIKEADSLIRAAKTTGKGSTEAAVIRRNSLINSDGKLKTGKLLKRFSQIVFEQPIKEAKEEEEEDTSEESEGKSSAEEAEEAKEADAREGDVGASATAPEPQESSEDEESEAEPEPEPESDSDDGGLGKIAPPAVLDKIDVPRKTSPSRKSSFKEPEPEPEPESDSDDGGLGKIAPPAVLDKIDVPRKTSPSRKSSFKDSPKCVKVLPEPKQALVPEPEVEIPDPAPRQATADPFLAAASMLVDGLPTSSGEDSTSSGEVEGEAESEGPTRSLDSQVVATEPPRYRSSVDNVDVTAPSFLELPEEPGQVTRTSSLDNRDVTVPNFIQLPTDGPATEETLETSSSDGDDSQFEQFLFKEKTASDASPKESIDLPDEYVIEDSDSSEEEVTPPPIRLNRSNRRPSALRHSFVSTPRPAEEVGAAEKRSRQSDSSKSVFFSESNKGPSGATLSEQLGQAQTAITRAKAPSLDSQMSNSSPPYRSGASYTAAAPAPSFDTPEADDGSEDQEEPGPPPLPPASASRKSPTPEAAVVPQARTPLRDYGKDVEAILREKELHFERMLRQKDVEHQTRIENILREQNKKSSNDEKRFEMLKQGLDKKGLSLQQNLAGEMHEMRQGYERRIESLEQQLRSDESGRLKQIREEYDHMRKTMQEDFDHNMRKRESEVRADEANKLQQVREEYQKRIEKMRGEFEAAQVESQRNHEIKLGEQESLREHEEKKFEMVKSGYEEKIAKMEKKYESLAKTFKALKNHELDLQKKSEDQKAKEEMQKLHTILSLTWNMLSTVDSEIAHFESLELPGFDWDRHVVSIHGHQQQNQKYSLADLPRSSAPDATLGLEPPPLISSSNTAR